MPQPKPVARRSHRPLVGGEKPLRDSPVWSDLHKSNLEERDMPYVENETRPPEKKSTSMEYSGSEGKKEVTSHFGTNINPIAQGLKELDPETEPDPGVKSL